MKKYQVGTNYHSLKMSNTLLLSFRTAVLLTLFFNLVKWKSCYVKSMKNLTKNRH